MLTRATRDLIKAFAGGALIFYIGSSLAKLSDSARNLIFDVSQGSIFIGNAFLFGIAVVLGLIGGPLFVILVLKQKRASYVMAMALGVLNLSISLSLGNDLWSGVATLGVVMAVLLLIRYLIEALALTASTMNEAIKPTDLVVLVAIPVIPAIAGLYFSTPTVSSFVDPFLLSLAAGLFTFLVPHFIFDPSYEKNQFRFLAIIAGMSVTAIVELGSLLVGR